LLRLSDTPAQANDKSETIIAKHFALVDSNGNHRAGLGMENGSPVLYLKDTSGRVRVYMALPESGPMFVMKDANGIKRFFIDYDDNYGAAVGFMNSQQQKQLVLGIIQDSNPAITMFDLKGKGRLSIALSNGNPGLAFLDSRQQSQALIQARDGQGALVSLHDGKSEPAVAMGLREGRSFVYAYDRDKSGVFAGAQSGKGPALALKERGKIAWTAGGGGDVKALEQGLDAAGFGMDLLR